MKKIISSLPGTLALAILLVPLAQSTDAQELQSWPLVEHVGYHWKNELLFYESRVPLNAGDEGKYSVVDESRGLVPFQFWNGEGAKESHLAVLVHLPPYARRSFTLRKAAGQAKMPTDVKVSEEGGAFVLAAGRTAVKVARAVEFKPGTPFEKLPAPLQSVRGVSGRWLGEGALQGKQPVTRFQSVLEARGPLFAQVKVRYDFGPRQYYQVRVRVVAGEDVVLVEEDFALSQDDVKAASFVTPPNLAPPVGQPSHFNDWLVKKGIGWRNIPTAVDAHPCFRFNFTKGWEANRVRGTGIGQAKPAVSRTDMAFAAKDWRLGLVLTPFQERGYRQNAVGFDAANSKDYLGLFYRFGSRWIHPNENRVLMPWLDEGIVGHFLAYEGRREWGLMVAENGPHTNDKMVEHAGSVFGVIHRAHVKHGETPLDRVKDWVLDWKLPADAYYPRLYTTRDGLARIQRDYAKLGADVKKLIATDRPAHVLLTGDQATLQQEFTGHYAELRQSVLDFLDGGHNTTNTYTHRYQEVVRHSCRSLDIGLACSRVTAEERRRALAVVAFLAYKTSDRDYWPHHGYAGGPSNPNMMTIATNAAACCAGLLPGHPMQKEWLHLCERLTCADIDTSIGPDGTWLESPGYQGAGNTPMNQTVLILRNAGAVDLATHPRYGKQLMAVSRYFANLLTPPDPRFGGKRMPMALGDGMPYFENCQTYLAHGARAKYPREAGHALWAFNQMGRPIGPSGLLLLHENVLDGSIPEVPIDGGSQYFPAFGAMLRHGFGTKAETFLTYRQSNFAYGHYDDDQGSFSLFAKGAPLCLDWIDYSENPAEFHNRVDYGERPPWLVPAPDKVTLHAEADYVRSHELSRSAGKPAWRRQLVLVKDPNDPGDATYLVIRDKVLLEKPSTWNVWVMAKKGSEKISGNIARLVGQYDVDLSLHFYVPLEKPLTNTFLHHRTASYMQMDQDQTRIQASASRGGDYGVVLLPLRRGKDKEPTVRALKSGAVEIVWGADRRHLLFLFPEERQVSEAGLSFSGRGALVKYEKGVRTLVPLECDELK